MPAAILGRPVSFATDVARIGDVVLADANIGHGEPMLPAIAEVISIIDDGLPRREHVAQAHLARFDARLSPPVVIHRQTEPLLTDCEAVGCGVLPGRTHHAASLAGWTF